MAINPRSPRWRLYQSKAQPPTASQLEPGKTYESPWHQPWSVPVRQKIAPALAVALISSGLVYTVQPPAAAAAVTPAAVSSDVIFQRSFIYQAKAEPVPFFLSSPTGGVQTQSSVLVQSEYRFQYQANARPIVFQQTEIITADKWYAPWRDPVRQKAGLGASLQQASVGPVLEPNTQIISGYESRWHQPWSEPVRLKQFPTAEQRFAEFQPPSFETITVNKWFKSWNDPVRQRPGLSSQLQQSTTIDTKLIPDPAKLPEGWIQPFSDPTRINANRYFASLTASGLSWSTFTPSAVVTTAVTTSTISSDVIFQRSFIYQAHAEPTKLIIPTYFYEPLSEPPRVNAKRYFAALTASGLAWSTFTPSTTTVPTYFSMAQGDSGVTFQKTIIYQISAEVSLTVNAIGWYEPFSEPVRVKRSLGAYQQQTLAWGVTTPAVTPPTPAVTPSTYSSEVSFPRSFIYQSHAEPASKPIIPTTSWYGALSEPVRAKPKLHASQQQSLAWSTFTPAAAATTTYFPMAQGDSGVTFQRTVIYQISAEVSLTINSIGWFEPLTEPVRTKQFSVALQQSSFWNTVTPPPPVVPTYFSIPLTDPVRTNKFSVSLQQSFFWGVFTPAATPAVPAVTPATLSSDVVFQRSFIYQAYAKPVLPPTAETITVDKWYAPLRDPVRIKAGLPASEQQNPAFVQLIPNPSTLLEGWQYPWSEPVRTRYLAAAQQQFLAWQFIVIGETITEDKWHFAWSEPVRTKPRLPEAEQQFLALYAKPIVSFGFYGWLSEPVKQKPGLRTELQQTTTADTTVIPTSRMPNWLYPWSEPVRQKPGLRAGLQQVTTTPPTYPILSRLIQWFKPFDEPVREKRGFRAWLQQFYTVDTKPIAAQVQLVLNATETNKDVALFGIVVYNKAVDCKVSIKEIKRRDDGAVSIEET